MTVTTDDHPPGDGHPGRHPPRSRLRRRLRTVRVRWPSRCWRPAGRRPRSWPSGSAAPFSCWPSRACSYCSAKASRRCGRLRRLVVYGVVAVAVAQLCYFNAVQYLSVGVALLLEYLAPVLLIGWHWWRTKIPPTAPVIVGAGVADGGHGAGSGPVQRLQAASDRRALGARRGVVPVRVLHPVRRGRSERHQLAAVDDHRRHRRGCGRPARRRRDRFGAASPSRPGTVALVGTAVALVVAGPADRAGQRGLRLPVGHHRRTPARQLARVVRRPDRGDLRRRARR